MSFNEAEPLKQTPLHAEHAALGAKFTDFGGWDMPLKYASELDEHRAVREAAGLFDLSHMGEIWVEGADAATYLNSTFAGNIAVMAEGRAKYSLLLNESGGIIDDLIIYRLATSKFLVVPNAGNAAEVYVSMQERSNGFDVTVTDATNETALVALQGPKAAAIIGELMTDENRQAMRAMKYYSADRSKVAGLEVLLARTGYTGEDGFEIYLSNADAPALWSALLKNAEQHGLKPAGLAARDSLRLEAGMPLYGNELGPDILPAQAGLCGVVSFKKDEDFVGRAALASTPETAKVLVGIKGLSRRAGRSSYAVNIDGAQVGEITSGLPSPTLEYPIALAYVDRSCSEVGTEVEIDVRGKPQPAVIVALPFYRRLAV